MSDNNIDKVLYLMDIEWGWIKQRPHFIAECLTDRYEVITLSKKSCIKKAKNTDTPVRVVYPLRFIFERLDIIKRINTLIYKLYLNYYLKRCRYVWFCSPVEQLDYILDKCTNKHVIVYDCMDDMLAFPNNLSKKEIIKNRESKLVERANLMFCSSSHLISTIKERYSTRREIILVNNALNIDVSSYVSKEGAISLDPLFFSTKSNKITYIGTISEWFDFGLIFKILNAIPNTEIHLWGPCPKDIQMNNMNPMVFFHGSVDHKYVNAIMKGSHILIMPFILNELIESVNPVKLYEYIYSGVPCLAPKYGESLQFGDYCYLYDNHDDAIHFISRVLGGELNNKSIEECIEYAKKNTWKERAKVVMKALNDCQ